jgi:hypothetical protein
VRPTTYITFGDDLAAVVFEALAASEKYPRAEGLDETIPEQKSDRFVVFLTVVDGPSF